MLTLNSTNNVELVGFHDRVTDTYPTTASVTFALLDSSGSPLGTPLTGQPMTYVTGSRNKSSIYRGTISSTYALSGGTTYTLRITATYGGATRVFDTPETAEAG